MGPLQGINSDSSERDASVIIETDAHQVVQLMEEDTVDEFPFKGLLEDAKIIFRGCEYTIQHVFKGIYVQMLWLNLKLRNLKKFWWLMNYHSRLEATPCS
ncbi:hypothetical protein ACSBR2_023870 [Camellia fascicularis]